MRQTKAVAKHDGCTSGLRLPPGVKSRRRACAARGWYWTREQQADPLGELRGLRAIERDLGPAVAAVRAVYEGTFKDILCDGLDAGAGGARLRCAPA